MIAICQHTTSYRYSHHLKNQLDQNHSSVNSATSASASYIVKLPPTLGRLFPLSQPESVDGIVGGLGRICGSFRSGLWRNDCCSRRGSRPEELYHLVCSPLSCTDLALRCVSSASVGMISDVFLDRSTSSCRNTPFRHLNDHLSNQEMQQSSKQSFPEAAKSPKRPATSPVNTKDHARTIQSVLASGINRDATCFAVVINSSVSPFRTFDSALR